MVISEELMKAVKPFVDLAYAAQDVDMVAYNDDEELALHATGAWAGACVTKKQCRDLLSAYKNAKTALEPQGQALPELPKDQVRFNLKAMASKYPDGHNWDKLDADVCMRAYEEITALREHIKATASQLALPAGPTDEQMMSAIRELFDNAPYNDGVPFVQCSDVLDVIDAVYAAWHTSAALRQPSLLKLVGEAGSMPGTSGFTMACFKADEVPLGTKLYARAALGQPAEEGDKA